MSYDITWCADECDNMNCFRNVKHIVDKEDSIYYSFASFRGTEDCIEKNMEKKEELKETVTTEERGWVGHFICGKYCLFRRNTLVSYKDTKWVVSTVGAYPAQMDMPDLGIKAGQLQQIGHNRWYETMVFESLYDEYDDADVMKEIDFESDWGIWGETWEDVEKQYGKEVDLAANKMHDTVVAEIKEKIVKEVDADVKASNIV